MRYEVRQIPEGWAGTGATVAAIRQLVDRSLTDPAVVTTAQGLVRGVRERDRWGELQAVSAYVRRHLRYTNETIETIKAPSLAINEIQRSGSFVGDCDDAVTLWAALLRALGHEIRYVVVSQRADGEATHIWAEDNIPGRGWVADDTIVKGKGLGWRAPAGAVTKERVYMGGMNGLSGGIAARLGTRHVRPMAGLRMRPLMEVVDERPVWRPAGTGRLEWSRDLRSAVEFKGGVGYLELDEAGRPAVCCGVGDIFSFVADAVTWGTTVANQAMPIYDRLKEQREKLEAEKKAKEAAAAQAAAQAALLSKPPPPPAPVPGSPPSAPAWGAPSEVPWGLIALAGGGLLLLMMLKR